MRLKTLLILPLLVASLQAADKIIHIDFCAEPIGNPGIILPVEPPQSPTIYVGDNVEIIVDTCDIVNGPKPVVIGFSGEARQATPTGIPGQYSCIFSTENPGIFSLFVTSIDDYGNLITSTEIVIAITAASPPPTVTITSPTNGGDSPYSLGDIIAIEISASDSDGNVTQVEVFNGANSIGLANLVGVDTYRLDYQASSPGLLNLLVRATDDLGNIGLSDLVPVSVIAGDIPTASINNLTPGDSIKSGETLDVYVTATDTDGFITSVEVFNNAVSLGLANPTGSASEYLLSYRTSAANLGNLNLQARAVDNHGNVGYSAVIAYSVDHDKNGPYSYVPGFFTWEEARLDAIARGGHLATITSEDENNTVSSVTDDLVFLDPNPGSWIGATDEDSEGNWVWVTGEPFGYTPPDFNPDNYQGSQHYIVTNYREIGFWDDDFLTSSRGYILEKRDLVEWSQDFTSPVAILDSLGGLTGDTHAYTWSKTGNGLANGGSVTQDENNNKVVLEVTDNGPDGEVKLHMVGPSTTNHRRFKPISHETKWEIDLIAFRNGQADLMLQTRGNDGYVKSTIAPSGVIKYSTWMADYDHTNFDNFSGPSNLRNSTNKPGIVIVDGGTFDPASADPVTITISGNAVGTVNMNTAGNAVESVTLSDYGSGYTAEPTVTFAGRGMTVAPTVSFNYSTGNLLEEHVVQVDIALQENGTKNWSLLADGQTLTYIQSYNSTDDSISYYYSLTDGDGVTTGPIFITTLTAAEHSAGGLGFFDVSTGYKWARPNNQDAVVITYKRYVGADAAVSTVGINSVAIEFTDNDGDPIIDPETLTFLLNGNGTEYSVTDCLETTSGILDIPSTYNGIPVTSIGNGAFSYCTNLSGITIPDSVTSIGEGAFSHCANLTSITISDSVTSIGSSAFSSCYSLSSITIPDSVTSIGDHAFYTCSSLSSINIPDSVTSIGDYSFYACSSLTSITIPDSVSSIGDHSFYACSNLKNITIPNNVTYIGVGAFYNCTSLASITIPDSVTSIGRNAFENTQGSISFSRHLLEAAEAERDARLTMDEVKDIRVGPTMIEVSSGKADITITLEEASDLSDWSNATTSEKTIEVDAPPGTRFYRFKMAD
jgi:hypothetical protein